MARAVPYKLLLMCPFRGGMSGDGGGPRNEQRRLAGVAECVASKLCCVSKVPCSDATSTRREHVIAVDCGPLGHQGGSGCVWGTPEASQRVSCGSWGSPTASNCLAPVSAPVSQCLWASSSLHVFGDCVSTCLIPPGSLCRCSSPPWLVWRPRLPMGLLILAS